MREREREREREENTYICMYVNGICYQRGEGKERKERLVCFFHTHPILFFKDEESEEYLTEDTDFEEDFIKEKIE